MKRTSSPRRPTPSLPLRDQVELQIYEDEDSSHEEEEVKLYSIGYADVLFFWTQIGYGVLCCFSESKLDKEFCVVF